MASKPFHFKRFSVRDDRCAHKVGTDGVLLGSWIRLRGDEKFMLDIGTGCGLIALMLAQRSGDGAHIDALDIEEQAVQQAIANVSQSPWPQKISLWHTSLQDFISRYRYDVIVSNPPYFVSSLLPPEKKRSRARHTQSLSFEDLIAGVVRLLSPGGKFAVVLPYHEGNHFIELASAMSLFPERTTSFRARTHKKPERLLIELSAEQKRPEENELVLYEDMGETWTRAYKTLTTDFYLQA